MASPPEFVKQVVSAYEGGRGVFENRVNAEDLVPSRANDLEKSLYLFYIIQLDYATKSSRLYEGARKLYEEIPDFYKPETIVGLSDTDLEKILLDYLKPRYINEAKLRYKTNSEKLLAEYGGDPRNIFNESGSAIKVLKAVRSFRGFGPKIGNFYVRTMINAFDYKYDDVEDIMPPVDVHDVNIAYLLGYVDSKKMTQKNISEVKKLWSSACKDAKESWLVFDKALWLLGSEGRPKSREDVFSLIK